ncbi:MAG TPA: hypothetical protein VK147_12985 [Candidatus Didemnitutus sp.]|nr:hypothetical protein [Candidatus Didemnitutus sp.]
MRKKNKAKSTGGGTSSTRRSNWFWKGLDNLKVSLGTGAAWKDNAMALLGGVMYVIVPTAIEAVFRVDLTGWRGYLSSVSINLAIGGVFRSPGYMAGTLGVASAHMIYAKLQDPIIRPIFKKYAYRFDPTVTTSSMSDADNAPAAGSSQSPAKPPISGMEVRSVGGEKVLAYPPSPNVAKVDMASGAMPSPMLPAAAGAPNGVADNFQQSLMDNYSSTLMDNYQATLMDGASHSSGASSRSSQRGAGHRWNGGWDRARTPSRSR